MQFLGLRKNTAEKGNSLLETVIIMPIFVLFIFSVFDLGILLIDNAKLENEIRVSLHSSRKAFEGFEFYKADFFGNRILDEELLEAFKKDLKANLEEKRSLKSFELINESNAVILDLQLELKGHFFSKEKKVLLNLGSFKR